ncbi:MAG: tetratricopeptide repeat protein [Candidatus Heimdallarchaeota archaeon]|nr:tetratricopeptide repeat protein [Candidatus Heimdallarchaeota archaeon]
MINVDIVQTSIHEVDLENYENTCYMNMAEYWYRRGKFTTALNFYALALEFDGNPNLFEIYLNKGLIFKELGDIPTAIYSFSKASEFGDIHQQFRVLQPLSDIFFDDEMQFPHEMVNELITKGFDKIVETFNLDRNNSFTHIALLLLYIAKNTINNNDIIDMKIAFHNAETTSPNLLNKIALNYIIEKYQLYDEFKEAYPTIRKSTRKAYGNFS